MQVHYTRWAATGHGDITSFGLFSVWICIFVIKFSTTKHMNPQRVPNYWFLKTINRFHHWLVYLCKSVSSWQVTSDARNAGCLCESCLFQREKELVLASHGVLNKHTHSDKHANNSSCYTHACTCLFFLFGKWFPVLLTAFLKFHLI